VADFEIGESVEHDLRFVRELHFDERIASLRSGDDGVDDAVVSDPSPVDVAEVRRFDAGRADADGLADEDFRAIGSVRFHKGQVMEFPYSSRMDAPSHPTIGCTFSSDDAAVAAARALTGSGAASGVGIGASDRERATRIAQAAGIDRTLEPSDPLGGIPGLASGEAAAAGVNNGAVAGGTVGGIAGIAVGFSSAGALLPADGAMRVLAWALLLFAVGVAIGGVLGGAFGSRPSTHAGFRLIDAMEEGGLALVATIDGSQVDAVKQQLEAGGAADVVVIEASAAPRDGPARA
jgi:hypothetical protein